MKTKYYTCPTCKEVTKCGTNCKCGYNPTKELSKFFKKNVKSIRQPNIKGGY